MPAVGDAAWGLDTAASCSSERGEEAEMGAGLQTLLK